MATGTTGILLAQELIRQHAHVTLLLGPAPAEPSPLRGARIIRFSFFDELAHLLKKEITSRRHHAVIHAAAVSDYRPSVTCRGKISSDKKQWPILLEPTPKLIDSVKTFDPQTLLIGFKYEPTAAKAKLVDDGLALMRRSRADAVVANTARGESYRAYILENTRIVGPLKSKKAMSQRLIRLIGEKLCMR